MSEFKSEDPGFGNNMGTVFLSFRVNSCADLFGPDPACIWYGHTKILKYCTHKVWNELRLGSATLSQLAFLRESDLNFPWEEQSIQHTEEHTVTNLFIHFNFTGVFPLNFYVLLSHVIVTSNHSVD